MTIKQALLTAGLVSLMLTSVSYVNKKKIDSYHLKSGVNITCFEKQEFSSREESSIDRLIESGFSTIALNPIYFQDNIESSEIEQQSSFDEKHLDDLITYAQSRGLDVMLKPLINTKSDESRTQIMPQNIDEWFQNYNNILVSLAKLGRKHDVYGMTIMCELDSLLIHYPKKFEETISKIKETGFNGKLTAAVVYHDESCNEKIEILNQLPIDFIGIDFYVSMLQSDLSKEEKFYEQLYYLEKIQSIAQKPLLIAEVGYRSVENGNKRPMYNYRIKGNKDQEIQKESYENFIKAFTHKKLDKNKLEGIFFWITDSQHLYTHDILETPVQFGIPWEIGYTPFNKPAEEVMKKYNKDRLWFKYPNKLIQRTN